MVRPSKIVQEWFRFSRQDLLAAKTLMSAGNSSLWANVGFLCQQSAEKAIKGALAHHKTKFGKTHELEILGFELSKIYPDLQDLMKSTTKLTPFAVEFRYPESGDQRLTESLVHEAIRITETVLEKLSSKITPDMDL